MRRITSALFAAVGLTAGLGQVALAADLPQRPAPVPPPMIAPAPTRPIRSGFDFVAIADR